MDKLTKEEFIKKWNVAYEDYEQRDEFSAEMEADLEKLIEAEKPKWIPVEETTHLNKLIEFYEAHEKNKTLNEQGADVLSELRRIKQALSGESIPCYHDWHAVSSRYDACSKCKSVRRVPKSSGTYDDDQP